MVVATSAATSTICVGVLEGRDLRGLRVVVDAANGAASHLAGDVFVRAGAQVVVINASPDGRNINAALRSDRPGRAAGGGRPPSAPTRASPSTVTPTV